MGDILTSLGRALRSLSQPVMVWHLVWPTLGALVLWGAIGIIFWDDAALALQRLFDSWQWLHNLMDKAQFVSVATLAVVHVLLVLLFLPLIYATALLLVAIVALPMMLERVSEREYADLERRRGGSNAGSVGNALTALGIYLAGWVLTLPLWLIPGVGLILPLLLAADLNQRAYRYDALMVHADRAEMRSLIGAQRGNLYLLGITTGALAYVPVVNLVVPAFAGLAFVHFCLESLRRRRAAGLAGAGPRLPG